MLRRMASDNILLRDVRNGQSPEATLASAEADIIWSVVDYSTMSNRAIEDVEYSQLLDSSPWPNSWMGLFGTMEDVTDFTFDMMTY